MSDRAPAGSPAGPGRRLRALVLVVVAGGLVAGLANALIHRPGTVSPAPSSPSPSGPFPVGQVVARDGRFWVGPNPVVLRGVLMPLMGQDSRFDRVASWGMNLVRLQVNWARLEPSPPVRQTDGTWVHSYDRAYLALVAGRVQAASERGLFVVLGNYRDRLTYFGYPDWAYRAPYNSHGTTYPRTPAGYAQAETDFWSDPLRRRFMTGMLAYLAGGLRGVRGVAGYEMLNEPQRGGLPSTVETARVVFDWQLAAARAVRRADPARTVFFMGMGFNDVGLSRVDLSGFEALDNVALDFHDYFGARWGSGWLEDPASPERGLANQHVFAPVTVEAASAAPFIGSALSEERQLRSVMSALSGTGIPLLVGECGDYGGDPGISRYLGTATSTYNRLGLSWACNWLGLVTDNLSGDPLPWTPIVIRAAREAAAEG